MRPPAAPAAAVAAGGAGVEAGVGVMSFVFEVAVDVVVLFTHVVAAAAAVAAGGAGGVEAGVEVVSFVFEIGVDVVAFCAAAYDWLSMDQNPSAATCKTNRLRL